MIYKTGSRPTLLGIAEFSKIKRIYNTAVSERSLASLWDLVQMHSEPADTDTVKCTASFSHQS
jgi:hypothetical protein